MKIIINKIRDCMDCPWLVFKNKDFGWYCEGFENPPEIKFIANQGFIKEIPLWCPLPDYKEAKSNEN